MNLSRRMLQTCTPNLVDCSVTSCPTPLALTGAQLALLCPVPGLPGAVLYGTVTGFGFSTGNGNTDLYKQATLSAEGLSFDVILSGRRRHYAHIQVSYMRPLSPAVFPLFDSSLSEHSLLFPRATCAGLSPYSLVLPGHETRIACFGNLDRHPLRCLIDASSIPLRRP